MLLPHSMTCAIGNGLLFVRLHDLEQVLAADELHHEMGRLALLDEVVDARHDRDDCRATRRISASRRKKLRRMANSCGSLQIMSLMATARSPFLVSSAR